MHRKVKHPISNAPRTQSLTSTSHDMKTTHLGKNKMMTGGIADETFGCSNRRISRERARYESIAGTRRIIRIQQHVRSTYQVHTTPRAEVLPYNFSSLYHTVAADVARSNLVTVHTANRKWTRSASWCSCSRSALVKSPDCTHRNENTLFASKPTGFFRPRGGRSRPAARWRGRARRGRNRRHAVSMRRSLRADDVQESERALLLGQ